jgi:hypothetical protein
MIRALPGSVKDITSLYNSLGEVGTGGKILILDRGFFSQEVVELSSAVVSKIYLTRIKTC